MYESIVVIAQLKEGYQVGKELAVWSSAKKPIVSVNHPCENLSYFVVQLSKKVRLTI